MPRISVLLGALGLSTLLTACPGYTPPSFEGMRLTLTYPATTSLAGGPAVRASLVWYDAAYKSHLLGNDSSSYSYPDYASETSATVYANQKDLDALIRNPEFLTTFVGHETADKVNVNVLPQTVMTGNLFPVLWRDLNNDGLLSGEGEILYDTHDMLSYASGPFTYSFDYPGENALEHGSRVQGWSRVHHVVLQPLAAPGHYDISMDSLTNQDYFLHEPSRYLNSMSTGDNK